MEPRLKPGIWVKALIRRLDVDLITAVVVRSGDSDGGAVYLKINRMGDGCQVFNRTYGAQGERVWMSATGEVPVDEGQADEYLARQFNFDPDCWVIEIEDPGGRFSIQDLEV